MAKVTRAITIGNDETFARYSDWQSLYMRQEDGSLIPDTEIRRGGELLLRINSLGCKGPDLVSGLPVVGFFGDSATFGVSMGPQSWVGSVGLQGVQCLNAAGEGYNLDRCFARYQELAAQVPFVGVAVYSGWHNIIYNNTSEDYWCESLLKFSGKHVLAFCSLATCLTEECKQRGIDSLLNSDVKREDYANYFEYNMESLGTQYFNFWCNLEPTLEKITAILDGVNRYNAFLQRFCRSNGFVFIDLHALLKPTRYENIPRDFFDVCHFRPRAYEKIGRFVADQLQDPLARHLKSQGVAGRALPLFGFGKAKVKPQGEDLRKNIYPLW